MKIEQRIGRLSRIGQTHDVYVYNLVAADTIEAAVLHLLEAKLNMFELVIGEIDMILGNLDDETRVSEMWSPTSGRNRPTMMTSPNALNNWATGCSKPSGLISISVFSTTSSLAAGSRRINEPLHVRATYGFRCNRETKWKHFNHRSKSFSAITRSLWAESGTRSSRRSTT